MSLSQDVVEQFGFTKNPFDPSALSLNSQSVLPIAKAFVGRDISSVESRTITNILRLSGGNRFVVEGEVGVGKTTFVNYHRYLWENESRDKLFTPTQEISFDPNWNTKDFLLNILSRLVQKLIAQNSEKILKNLLVKKIFVLTQVSTCQWQGSVGGPLGGLGLGFGKNEIITVPPLSEALLFMYFQDLVEEIKNMGYAGLYLHIDNFEQSAGKDTQKIQTFFQRVRDILQTRDVYFAFVGYRGFYHEIIYPIERVRSIFFNLPIYIPPLAETEVLEVIAKRYELLSKGKFIKPVDDAFIHYLYRLYDGKIRSLLDSLSMIIANFPPYATKTLQMKEAKEILVQEMKDRVASILSEKDFAVLWKIAEEGECTNAQLAKKFKQNPQSIAPVIKELEKLHLIYLARREGRQIFYKVDEPVKILQGKSFAKSFAALSPSEETRSCALSATQSQFMELLASKGKLTLTEFCQLTETPTSHARREVNGLARHHLIAKHGFTRGLYYTRNEGA
jgi:DNA-binding transcriptional ArsR family regulator